MIDLKDPLISLSSTSSHSENVKKEIGMKMLATPGTCDALGRGTSFVHRRKPTVLINHLIMNFLLLRTLLVVSSRLPFVSLKCHFCYHLARPRPGAKKDRQESAKALIASTEQDENFLAHGQIHFSNFIFLSQLISLLSLWVYPAARPKGKSNFSMF